METQLQTSVPEVSIPSRVNGFIVAVCLAAGLRILIFSIGLPFFPLDEELHFDAIHKFATGYTATRDLPGFDPTSAELIELYHSPEFLKDPLPGKPFLPLPWWCNPTREHLPPELAYRVNEWLELRNVEINAPPLYYVIGANWYKMGRLLGYSGIFLLYWLRSLNAIVYALFVAISWLFVKECYPENSYLHVSVPLFLAVFPQDALLFMIPNAMAPVFVAGLLLLLARLVRQPLRKMWFYLGVGLCAASAALVGFGNFLIAIPLAIAVWSILGELRAVADKSRRTTGVIAMLTVAAVPIGLWLMRNRVILGDWSGSKTKQQYLGWSIQPFAHILRHPLFTWSGASYFFNTLSRNFWRGEMYWHAVPRVAWFDPIYLFGSILCCGAFVVLLFRSPREGSLKRFADFSSGAMVVGSVLFLMAISIPFDFGHCFYPSRARPYFVSGRIIIGVLLPFAIMFLRGLQILCNRVMPTMNPLIPAIAIAAGVFVAETWMFIPMLSSHFNMFSLILGRSCG